MVAVLADHPPKIKLDTCLKGNNKVYKLSIQHARTLLVLIFVLFIEFRPHLVFTSCETLTLTMT